MCKHLAELQKIAEIVNKSKEESRRLLENLTYFQNISQKSEKIAKESNIIGKHISEFEKILLQLRTYRRNYKKSKENLA